MNILIIPITAILIGLLVRSRLLGVALFLSIQAVFYTFQTLVVLLAWMAGQGGFGEMTEQGAFGPAPTGFPIIFDESEVWAYGLVNLGLIGAGLVILLLLATLMQRRRASKATVSSM